MRELVALAKGMGEALIEQSTEALRLQLLELEHAFLSLVLGAVVGVPVMPYMLAKELLPLVADEVSILVERSRRGGDVISDFFASLGGEW